ncbi:gluconeogenesis factor-like isoform X3 [Triticum dicoccoides]|uniref:gluconeogenesis factor-like isoform X3 n=1 Tax=Triticum dicoccoides TaxID=85692 RepID=UPI00188EDBA9|nr:gluconeogenesis factor-like isoform X3 [Triticum dicoccoides]
MRCGRGCSFLRPGVHPMPLLATPPYIMPRTSAATAGPATATSSGTCSLRVRLRAPGRSAAAASSSRLPRAMAATGADAAAAPPSLLVFSGGTAFNGVVEELKKVTTRVAHVLPVSDDGGSTAEIVRVLGGPAVGDIRSRCLRLSDESTLEALSVRRLLGHRLPLDPSEAKLEWYHIVEGEHSLWDGVSRPYRETIRAFLVYFHNEDGTIIRGQNEISHPSNGRREVVDKNCNSCTALPSSIKRVFYMSSEGCNLLHEVFPEANHTVLEQLSKVDCIVYAMGSLFTSVCPSLVLRGIGETIASRSIPKVLLLNGSHDRETIGLSASGFVTAITDSLNRTYGDPDKSLKYHPKDYVNAILVPEGGQIPLDVENLASKGIFHVLTVKSVRDTKVGVIFDPQSLIQALTGLISEHMDACLAEPDPLTENVTSVC